MGDPFHHDSSRSGADSTLGLFVPRNRSSYASAASGSNPAIPSASHLHINRLSQVLNLPYEPSSELYSTSLSSRSHTMDFDTRDQVGEGRPPGLSSQASILPKHSRAFEGYFSQGSMWIKSTRSNTFFTPSYLRGSNYMKKLEESHISKQLQKESQQQTGSEIQGVVPISTLGAKTPAAHLGMTYDLIERAPIPGSEDKIPPLPTRWNKEDKYGSLEVTADGLEIKYSSQIRNPREQEYEICGIRADQPMPSRAGIYYFEITILSTRREEYVKTRPHSRFASNY